MRTRRVTALLASAGLALVVWACGRNPLSPLSFGNQPPEVRIVEAPSVTAGENVLRQVRWDASDSDGRIDHYLVAVAPSTRRGAPTWTRSDQATLTLSVPTKQAAKRARGADPVAETEFTIFSVRAVDDRGAMSEPAQIAFFGENLPPVVRITSPIFSSVNVPLVTSTPRIRWQGEDPDGVFTQEPVSYRYRVFGDGPAPADFPFPVDETNFMVFISAHPDSFRRGYAPTFPGWTAVGGGTTDVVLGGLIEQHEYMFAITGFDEAGDYDPIFDRNKNLLKMYVVTEDQARPRINVFNEFFDYTYPNGSLSTDPSREVPITIESDQRVTIRWKAIGAVGATIVKTRWSLTREGEGPSLKSEWARWAGAHAARVGPFPDGQDRLFYVEVEDDQGSASLGIVRIHSVSQAAKRPLLIVNDTRFLPDSRNASGALLPPTGPWPTAAELDTFLFAVGGFPWQGYPAGTMSTTGLFAGYEFDTLGTRTGQADLSVPLETLARYENVVWIVDKAGAENNGSGTNPVGVRTALRHMSYRNRFNSLAAYVEQGGKLWLLGGGAARATLLDWFAGQGATPEFCASDGELGPGRMMYDQAHWRSCLQVTSASSNGRAVKSASATGNWPGAPDYTLFPSELLRKTAASDPVPPLRQPSQFYSTFFWYEYLTTPNTILESTPQGPVSTLDTLYQVSGGAVPAGAIRPVMTLYHGVENPQFIFSGFDLWTFRRSDCKQLVDAVLGVWGVQKRASPQPNVSAGDPASLAAPTSPLATRRR